MTLCGSFSASCPSQNDQNLALVKKVETAEAVADGRIYPSYTNIIYLQNIYLARVTRKVDDGAAGSCPGG